MYIPKIQKVQKKECNKFYHSFTFPDGEEVIGEWDLRHCIKEYLSNVDFTNQSVIDVGAASGFLTFHMEKVGAFVTSFDMPSYTAWDQLKYRGYQKDIRLPNNEKQFNTYCYAYHKYQSSAKVYRNSIYSELPDSVPNFNGAIFGTILAHLRDPMLALMNILMKVDDFAVLINPFPDHVKRAAFVAKNKNFNYTWWSLSLDTIEKMVNAIGWKIENVTKVNPIENTTNGKSLPREYKSVLIKRI